MQVEDLRPGAEWPDGHKPLTQEISHDALYRVVHVSHTYTTGDGQDESTDWRAPEEEHREADPIRSTAAHMIAAQAEQHVVDLDYSHDWLANMTTPLLPARSPGLGARSHELRGDRENRD